MSDKTKHVKEKAQSNHRDAKAKKETKQRAPAPLPKLIVKLEGDTTGAVCDLTIGQCH